MCPWHIECMSNTEGGSISTLGIAWEVSYVEPGAENFNKEKIDIIYKHFVAWANISQIYKPKKKSTILYE